MIHIITPCSRPDNLEIIKKSIPETCLWWVGLDAKVEKEVIVEKAKIVKSPYSGNFGNMTRNYVMENLQADDSDWVYFLDDDNVVHPEWLEGVSDHLKNNNFIVWGQLHKNGQIRLKPVTEPRVNRIDTACFMIRWEILKNFRFHESAYAADGILAEKIYDKVGCTKLDKYLCYYNFIR